uniref:SPATA31-like domain-containing protein n=1 Tax=Loxodonta africana TaxID=9785 RepID=G3TPK7_LOXAF
MLCPTFLWCHAGYPLYKYASIFCLIINIWQMKKKYHGFRLESKRSSCKLLHRVQQRIDPTSQCSLRALHTQESSETLPDKPKTLRQGWLPQEGRALQLLHADLCYQISNDTALDIQQLVTGKNTLITPTSAGTSQHSSCLEILSISGVSKQSLQLRSKNSRELLLASVTSTLLKLTDQKSLTQTAAPSTGVVSIQDHWDEHLQLGKGFQLPDVPRDAGTRTSSSLEETRVPVNQQEMMYSSHKFLHGNQ